MNFFFFFINIVEILCPDSKTGVQCRPILEFSCHQQRNNLGTYWRNFYDFQSRVIFMK